MKTKIFMSLLVALTLTISAVYAQKPGHRQSDNNRYDNRDYDRYRDYDGDNYRNGNRNGNISRYEAREIARRRAELQRKIDMARRNDGYISRRERRWIEKEWRELNRDIKRYNNNSRGYRHFQEYPDFR